MLNAVMQECQHDQGFHRSLLRTKSIPCFKLPNMCLSSFLGKNLAVMIESEMTGARNDNAFSPKHHFSPSLASVSRPAPDRW